jgi:hypothetical protein
MDGSDLPVLARLQRELVAMSCQLAELDVLLDDYHLERDRLIHDVRKLQMELTNVREQLPASPANAPDSGLAS